MLLTHDGESPTIGDGTRVAPNAVICGAVRIGRNCSIGFGAVLTAESGPITIGDNCVVMENAVVRSLARDPVAVGDNVLIGPHGYLTGCTIADDVFIATGATIFNGARIGARGGAHQRFRPPAYGAASRCRRADRLGRGWRSSQNPPA
jgi:carbonic anhydrase/acetyltransferase-like protein (isoleucine patch superfamily)